MSRRLRLGMIGGGQGAFIGAVHRIASRIDDRYELLAGCLSSTADRAHSSAKDIGLNPDRSYEDFKIMAERESSRKDGIEVVSIVTPNHMHASPAIEFLKKGVHVICDKPMTATMDEALKLNEVVNNSKAHFFLTHNYLESCFPNSVASLAAFLSAGVCPTNVLVGANSPNLWPTISSEIVRGINFLPL